jgi:phosphoheptose isomerase
MRADAVRERIVRSLQDGADLRLRLIQRCTDAIIRAADAIRVCFERGGKLLLFGNGGSAADAQHIAAEFVGRFGRERVPLPAIALTTDSSVLTAVSNDYGFHQVFARQIRAIARPRDVVIAISTSGRSPNVLGGLEVAAGLGLVTIGLTGGDGGQLARMVDIPIVVPSTRAARIQECHITIGHVVCEAVEATLEEEGAVCESAGCQPGTNKIVGWDVLLATRERWRAEGKKVVWTNGCFDLLHLGHVRALQMAKALGDVLVVGVNSDNSVRTLKGPDRPIFPVSERLEVLAALECVDFVVVFEELTPADALARLKPDIHCKGADYRPPSGRPMVEASVVEAYGGRMKFLPLLPGHSTSEIVLRLQKTAGHQGRKGT